jgi:hypothetical protein
MIAGLRALLDREGRFEEAHQLDAAVELSG